MPENEREFSTDPYYSRLRLYLSESSRESERGQVLVSCSLLEEMLEEIIRAALHDSPVTNSLFRGNNPPLGNLYAKNGLAFAMGLTKRLEYDDVDRLRHIRNRFAHSVQCSFEDPSVIKYAAKLSTGMHVLDKLPKDHESRVDDPVQRFRMVAVSLISDLYNRAHYASKTKRVVSLEWVANFLKEWNEGRRS